MEKIQVYVSVLQAANKLLYSKNGSVDLTALVNDIAFVPNEEIATPEEIETANNNRELMKLNVGLAYNGLTPSLSPIFVIDSYYDGREAPKLILRTAEHVSLIADKVSYTEAQIEVDENGNAKLDENGQYIIIEQRKGIRYCDLSDWTTQWSVESWKAKMKKHEEYIAAHAQ